MIVRSLQKEKNVQAKINYMLKLALRSFMIASVVFFMAVMIFMFMCMRENDSQLKTVKEKQSSFGTYIIVSESMVPTIKVNDAIVVKRVDDDNLEIGDIITFSSTDRIYKGLTITHRIIGIQKNSNGDNIYRTKGDNNVLADTALVDFNNIYGKVILKIPKIGYIQKFVSSTTGFIVSIFIPIFVVVVYEVLRIRNLIKKQDEEMENL